MGFNVFSQPLNRARLGGFAGAGAAAGAGAGALLAGRNHRTAGAVVGGGVGGGLSSGAGIYGRSAISAMSGAPGLVRDAFTMGREGGGMLSGVKAAASMAGLAGRAGLQGALRNPNITEGLAKDFGSVRSAAVSGYQRAAQFLNRFRK